MRRIASAPLLVVAGIAACTRASAPASYEAIVRITEGSAPLAGVRVLAGGQTIGTTGERGTVKISLRGKEGEIVPLTVACPEGFRSAAKTLDVPLRRLAEPDKVVEFAATCARTKRTVVVAVRAENGPNLPVVYLGEPLARTDASGAAHVMLDLAPGEEFDLALDTSDKSAEPLRPQNPSAHFAVPNDDEILTFDVAFKVEVPKRAAPRAAAKPPQGPVHL